VLAHGCFNADDAGGASSHHSAKRLNSMPGYSFKHSYQLSEDIECAWFDLNRYISRNRHRRYQVPLDKFIVQSFLRHPQ